MNNFKTYFRIFLTIIASYITIKFIDNYKYFFNIITMLLSMLTPFIVAFILAYIFNPIVSTLEEKFKIKRLYALFITYGFVLIPILSSTVFIFPIIFENIVDLVNQIPDYINQTQEFFISMDKELKDVDPETLKKISNSIMSTIPDIGNLLVGSLGHIFSTTFSVGKFIVQLLLSFIICFYMLLEKEDFYNFSDKMVYKLFGEKFRNLIFEFLSTLNSNIIKYFSSKMLDSFIVGLLSGVGLFFIKSQYPLLFGVLIGFMNMIPYFGPVIGMAPVVIINLFHNPTIALISLGYLFLVQQIEMAVIEPKIVGGQLGISPFLTILSVTIGGGFFGIPGMILSVPIMGVIKIYVEKFLYEKN